MGTAHGQKRLHQRYRDFLWLKWNHGAIATNDVVVRKVCSLLNGLKGGGGHIRGCCGCGGAYGGWHGVLD